MSWIIGLSLVGAFGLGFWIARPRPYDQPLEEIEKRLQEEGEHQRVERQTTLIDLIQRQVQKGSARRRGERRPFNVG